MYINGSFHLVMGITNSLFNQVQTNLKRFLLRIFSIFCIFKKKIKEKMSYRPQPKGFSTKAIHVAQDPKQWPYQSIIPPIISSTNFKLPSLEIEMTSRMHIKNGIIFLITLQIKSSCL